MQLEGLTTPEKIDQKAASFYRHLSSQNYFYCNVEPELWPQQSTCEMNV